MEMQNKGQGEGEDTKEPGLKEKENGKHETSVRVTTRLEN